MKIYNCIAEMPRRDLTTERTGQILDAFEQCILRYGLEASSLERIAAQARIKRPIIRHYIGNRNALLRAMTDRLIARYRAQTKAMIAALDPQNRTKSLVDALFSIEMEETAERVMIFEHLVLASARDETTREKMAAWTNEFTQQIEDQICLSYPDASCVSDTAFGLVSIYFNYVSLLPLQISTQTRDQARAASMQLIAALGSGCEPTDQAH